MNKAHTNPDTTPKHYQSCHKDHKRVWKFSGNWLSAEISPVLPVPPNIDQLAITICGCSCSACIFPFGFCWQAQTCRTIEILNHVPSDLFNWIVWLPIEKTRIAPHLRSNSSRRRDRSDALRPNHNNTCRRDSANCHACRASQTCSRDRDWRTAKRTTLTRAH